MEMESSPPVVAKKLWHMVRIAFLMLRKGISKSKIMVDLNLMLKRGKLIGKAINNLMLQHHSTLTCRSDQDLSFISPREYEFSCSNSPAFNPFHLTNRRHRHHHHHHHFPAKSYKYDDVTTTVAAVQKVLVEMYLNSETAEASPLTTLPGFGKSPMVRQLRITDSPFPLKDAEEDSQVDKAADEFIKKFYNNLKLQKRTAALESPYHNMWAR